jgi:predicted nuclease with TOPRIM domain
MPNLYELMGEYDELQRALEDPEADRDAILEALDEAKGTLKEKVDNVCRVRASLTGDISKFKAEEARLAARRKTLENDKKRLENWVRETMTVLDVSKVKTDLHSVTVSPGQPTVVVTKLDVVPPEYLHPPKPQTVDKKKVLKVYKDDGEFVDGTDIVPGTPTLNIR